MAAPVGTPLAQVGCAPRQAASCYPRPKRTTPAPLGVQRALSWRQVRRAAPCSKGVATVNPPPYAHVSHQRGRAVAAYLGHEHPAQRSARERTSLRNLVVAVAAVLCLGTLNRVTYRLALVPMQNHILFLALLQNFSYLAAFWPLFFTRYRLGIITREMLAIPKKRFFFIGTCETASQLLLAVGAAKLPGAMLPLLSQAILVWSMVFSRIILNTRLTAHQLFGAVLVVGGVALASIAPSFVSFAVHPKHVLYCLLAFAFPALGTIIKEAIFREARRSNKRALDVIVVNTFSSTAQALCLLMLFPIIFFYRGIDLWGWKASFVEGLQCFNGITPMCGGDCNGAPLLPILYIVVNILYNISLLYTLRLLGAVSVSLLTSIMVPLTVLAFTVLPLPYLPTQNLGPNFTAGTATLVVGLVCYNWNVIRSVYMKVPWILQMKQI